MSSTIASLVANISANTSGLEAGLAAAKSSLQSTASELKSFAASSFSAQGALEGWTKSQYAAAAGGELLTTKALGLQKAVSSGAMTAAQATKEFSAYRAEIQRGVWQTMSFSEKANVLREKLAPVGMELVKIGAAATGVALAGKAIYSLARSGAEIEFISTKFDRLSASVGTTGDVFLGELRNATRGTVSDFGLMKQGADLLQLGLAKDSTEAIRLSKVMTALGMDTGELTLALANQSKRRLDQLGLSLSAFNKIESKLKGAGLSKEDAFKEAFLQTAEQTVTTTGNRADSGLGSFLRLEAQTSNALNTLKTVGVDKFSGIANNVSLFMEGISRLMSGETVLDLNAGNGMWARQAKAQDLSSLWATPSTGVIAGGSRYGAQITSAPVTGLSALQSYTAMAFSAKARGAAPVGGEGAAVATDYGTLLEGATKLTQIQSKNSDIVQAQKELSIAIADQKLQYDAAYRAGGKYYNQIEEARAKVQTYRNEVDKLSSSGLQNEEVWKSVNATYQKQLDTLNALEAAHGKTHDAVEKEKNKLADLENKQKDVKLAAQQQGDAMLMSTMKNMGATDEQALGFARATGMISDQAYMQQSVLMKIADAYNKGALSAEQAAAAGRNAMGIVAGMNGMYSVAQIDIIVNTIYTSSVFGGAKGLNRQNQAAVHLCFVPGTLIHMADGSRKPIEEVETGDTVLSRDMKTGQNIAAPVEKVFYHTAEEMGEYYLIINETIGVTPNHPLFINGEWKEAGTLKFGDILTTPDGELPVFSILQIYRKIETYNLHIGNENHNYFADGILAHNKASGGLVSAPGDGTQDTILVPLADGEMVINAAQTRKHKDLLLAINNGNLGNGLVVGGVVGKNLTTSALKVGSQGRTTTNDKFFSSGTTIAAMGGATGTGGDTADAISAAVSDVTPTITNTVVTAVGASLAQAPQLQAISESVDEIKRINENLITLISKTASAGDIGRSVRGAQALAA